MIGESLGRTGIVVLLIAIAILGGENLLIFLNSGALPAIEFLLFEAVVIAILAIAIREARRRRPP